MLGAPPPWPPRGQPWPLPPLREDLQLFQAAPQADGAPCWMIHDPASNRFYQIGWLEFELLSRWQLRDGYQVLDGLEQETLLTADEPTLADLIMFLRQQQLLRAADPTSTDYLKRVAARATESKLKWLLHNYLFFRLPLVHPQQFLDQTGAWVQTLFFSVWFLRATLFAALLGLLLVSRQWDIFTSTLADTFSVEGVAGYLLALSFAKTLHELGHAYTATRYGVRVAHMGVAFLVMWPMLYTDTSESWKLIDRSARFRIAAAGMAAEFSLAAWSTLGWCLLDDGSLRNALFFLATTSWVITLGINASPFMRFDGYFLLSDALDLPNLHQRAFAITRRWLRGFLFDMQEPDPEPTLTGRLRLGLILFSLITWSYRLIVFLGIAWAVYTFFFKLLGIFLFLVEIIWFVFRPIWTEVVVWQQRAKEISSRRRWQLSLWALVGLVILAWPWHGQVNAVAWSHATRHQAIYTPIPARLLQMHTGGTVAQGEVVAVLDSPDARSRATQGALLAQALELQLNQAVGRLDGLEKQGVFAEQLAQQQAEVLAATAELQRLELRASFAGELRDVDPQLSSGVWVNGQAPLAQLVDPQSWVVEALVDQRQVGRISVGNRVRYFDHATPLTAWGGQVIAIDSARMTQLPHPILAVAHGGPVVTLPGASNLVPRDGLYRVKIQLDHVPVDIRVALGRAQIEADPKSMVLDGAKRLMAVLVRESGF